MSGDESSGETVERATAVDSTVRATAESEVGRTRPRDSALVLVAGAKIGSRYEVRGYLGEGGMGAVYRAYDEILGVEIALKVVRGQYAEPADLRAEVRMATKVSHPNVCRIYDLEEIEGQQLVKMEYIAGETLAARIARVAGKGLPLVEALRIAREIVHGLGAAHASGLVHRDLKPANVMLATSGGGGPERVVLMDFGLARPVGDANDRSGTPGYMAPEQLMGRGVDQRADLFALGCLLYEMLAGEYAFAMKQGARYTELAGARVSQPPPSIRTRRPDVPRGVAELVEDLMAADPARRPRGVTRLMRGSSSSTRTALAFGIGATALGVGIAAITIARRPEPPAKWQPRVERIGPAFDGEILRRPSLSPDGTRLVYAADRVGNGRYVAYELVIDGGHPVAIPTKADHIFDVRYRRDGDGFLASTHPRGEPPKVVWQRRDGSLATIGEGQDPEDCGNGVVVTQPPALPGANMQLVVYEAGGRRTLVEAPDIDHPRCDAAGRRIVYAVKSPTTDGGMRSDIFMIDRTVATAVPEQVTVAGTDFTPTFTPAGTIVFSREGSLFEVAVPSRYTQQLTSGARQFTPEVSRDGSLLVFEEDGRSSALHIGGPSESVPRRLLLPQQELFAMQLTRDRKYIVAHARDPSGNHAIVRIASADGEQLLLGRGTEPFLSRDETQVYFVSASDRRELHGVPLGGGSPRPIAKLPRPIEVGRDTPEGIQVEILPPEAAAEATNAPIVIEPWLVDDSGRVKRDTLVRGQLGEGGPECVFRPTFLADNRVACQTDADRFVVFDATSKQSLRETTIPFRAVDLVVASDGEHWIATRELRPTVRYGIRRFDTRPKL